MIREALRHPLHEVCDTIRGSPTAPAHITACPVRRPPRASLDASSPVPIQPVPDDCQWTSSCLPRLRLFPVLLASPFLHHASGAQLPTHSMPPALPSHPAKQLVALSNRIYARASHEGRSPLRSFPPSSPSLPSLFSAFGSPCFYFCSCYRYRWCSCFSDQTLSMLA